MKCANDFKLVYSLFFFAVLAVFPCYGNGSAEQQKETQGILVFTGVSPKLTEKNEAIRNALNDAARKLSIFNYVTGNSVNREYIGEGVFDILIDSEYRLSYDNDLDKYIEKLIFNPDTDVLEYNNAVFVIVKCYTDVKMPAFRGHLINQSRPQWVASPPSEIEGFITGVGYSGKLSLHSDTVIRSYERAIISILKNSDINVRGEQGTNLDNYSESGTNMYSLNVSSSDGAIENFYIIDSWTDPANLSVWTLAVAKKRKAND